MPEKDVTKHKPIITDLTFFTNEPEHTLLDRFRVTYVAKRVLKLEVNKLKSN